MRRQLWDDLQLDQGQELNRFRAASREWVERKRFARLSEDASPYRFGSDFNGSAHANARFPVFARNAR